MDLDLLMTIPTQQTSCIPPTITFLPSKSPLKEAMYDPRTQFSNTNDNQDRSYGDRGTTNFVSKDRKITENYESFSNLYREKAVVHLSPQKYHQEAMESDDSGVCSPPLWKNNPSSPKSSSQPLLSHHNDRSLSPNSRTQAIVRGQWELMEMVKNMPESSYELTLKDLVENPKTESQASPQVERSSDKNQSLHQRAVVKVKRQESKKNDKNIMRRGSFENNGLFLKMVVPFSLKSKKKKNFASNTSGKVSPKPEVVKGGAEKDWWKKRFTGSSDSDSSRTSDNSGSTDSSGGSSIGRSNSNGRKRNGFLTGCWPCFSSKRNKKSEE